MVRAVDVDTVVIGSGAGGLTAALALANAGQKVLVLEQHYLPGGRCHSFSLEGQVGPWAFAVRTEFDGLVLCGSSTGAALSGLIAARELVSGKVADLLTHKRDEIVIVPSEDISSWPASLRRKMAPRTEEQHASP